MITLEIEPIDGYLDGHPVEFWPHGDPVDEFSTVLPVDEDAPDELVAKCDHINSECFGLKPSARLKIARRMGFTTD